MIELFAFRSAIPFAYLAFYGALLAAIVIGVVRLVRQRSSLSFRTMRTPVLFIVVPVALLGMNAYAEASLNPNPLVTDADLLGRWREGSAELTLEPSGAFTCRGGEACLPLGAAGRWARRGDADLTFTAPGARPIVRRVVTWRDVYRLTDMPDDDPDLWTGVLTFAHDAQ